MLLGLSCLGFSVLVSIASPGCTFYLQLNTELTGMGVSEPKAMFLHISFMQCRAAVLQAVLLPAVMKIA